MNKSKTRKKLRLPETTEAHGVTVMLAWGEPQARRRARAEDRLLYGAAGLDPETWTEIQYDAYVTGADGDEKFLCSGHVTDRHRRFDEDGEPDDRWLTPDVHRHVEVWLWENDTPDPAAVPVQDVADFVAVFVSEAAAVDSDYCSSERLADAAANALSSLRSAGRAMLPEAVVSPADDVSLARLDLLAGEWPVLGSVAAFVRSGKFDRTTARDYLMQQAKALVRASAKR